VIRRLLRKLLRRPGFHYAIADRDLDLWRCGLCQRIVSRRVMVLHAASKHGFDRANVEVRT
jgi:hypothetical protein